MAYMKLLREIADWPEEKATMEATVNSLEDEKNRMQGAFELELEKAREAHRKLEQENEKITEQKYEQRETMQMQEQQIASRDKEIEELKHAVHFAQESDQKLRAENEELKSKSSSREHELAEANIIIEAMKQDIVSLKEQVASEQERTETLVREAEEKTGSLFLYNLWCKRPDVDVSFFGPDAVAEVKLYAEQAQSRGNPPASSSDHPPGSFSAHAGSSSSSPRPLNVDDSGAFGQKNFPPN